MLLKMVLAQYTHTGFDNFSLI